MTCQCEELELEHCACSVCGSDCIAVTGSGNAKPFQFTPNISDAEDSILSCSGSGLLAKLPLELRIPPACRITRGSSQTISNDVGEAVDFTDSDYDNDQMHDDDERITFNTSGLYIVTYTGAFAGNAVGDRAAHIRKNGAVFLGGTTKYTLVGAGNEALMNIGLQDYFEEGEYIEVLMKQDSGGNLALLANEYSPFLAVRYRRSNPL